jgi:hypothetical protein
MNSPIIHDEICSLIHKKCHPKSYHSDIKYHMTLTTIFSVAWLKEAINGENWPLVTDEPLEISAWSSKLREITNHLRRIYGIYLRFKLKEHRKVTNKYPVGLLKHLDLDWLCSKISPDTARKWTFLMRPLASSRIALNPKVLFWNVHPLSVCPCIAGHNG